MFVRLDYRFIFVIGWLINRGDTPVLKKLIDAFQSGASIRLLNPGNLSCLNIQCNSLFGSSNYLLI